MKITLRKRLFKTARLLLREGQHLERLRNRMGSPDYRAAGALRPVFNRVVNENLSDVASAVRCPTLLLYGAADAETPPEMGQRFQKLIAGSELGILDGFGHLDILTEGRHQVALRIRRFIEAHGE